MRYSVSSTQPQGWPTAFSTSTVTLAPGQSMNVSMTKSVPASAVAGTYPVDAVAQDGTATVAAQASLTVLPPSPPLSVSFQAAALSAPALSSASTAVFCNCSCFRRRSLFIGCVCIPWATTVPMVLRMSMPRCVSVVKLFSNQAWPSSSLLASLPVLRQGGTCAIESNAMPICRQAWTGFLLNCARKTSSLHRRS
ncbi:MAG: hypothetical protein K6T59_15385, partial [Bryobacteraceae bacterium]|nr:hypothetical protein [Bryobacteraceae bacterium]